MSNNIEKMIKGVGSAEQQDNPLRNEGEGVKNSEDIFSEEIMGAIVGVEDPIDALTIIRAIPANSRAEGRIKKRIMGMIRDGKVTL